MLILLNLFKIKIQPPYQDLKGWVPVSLTYSLCSLCPITLAMSLSVPQIQEAPANTIYYLFYLEYSSLKFHGFSEWKGRDFGDGCIQDKPLKWIYRLMNAFGILLEHKDI